MSKKILLSVDIGNEDISMKPLEAALDLARDGGKLHIISVFPDFGLPQVSGYFREGYENDALKAYGAALTDWVNTHVPKGVDVQPHVGHGTIYDQVLKAADKLGVDVIVIGSHRPALSDYLLGPNASRVVRHAHQSVFVVRS